MVSDILCDSAESIKAFLEDPNYDGIYGSVRSELEALLTHMDEVRSYLDRYPGSLGPDLSQWHRVPAAGGSYQ